MAVYIISEEDYFLKNKFNVFSTDAIILKKTQIRDNKGLCIIYTKDFWKITCFVTESKTKSPVDIGGIINVQIKVTGQTNVIQSYKIKRALDYGTLAYQELRNILEIVALIQKTLPEWVPNSTLFDDYLKLLPYLETNERNAVATEFFKFKLAKYLWISLPHEHDPELQKIHSNIDRVNLARLCDEVTIHEAHIGRMRQYTEQSFWLYLEK